MNANDLILEILSNYSPNATVQVAIYNDKIDDYEIYFIDKIQGNDKTITLVIN